MGLLFGQCHGDDEIEETDPSSFSKSQDIDCDRPSLWKLDYILHLLKTKKWRDTVVKAPSGKDNTKISYLTWIMETTGWSFMETTGWS